MMLLLRSYRLHIYAVINTNTDTDPDTKNNHASDNVPSSCDHDIALQRVLLLNWSTKNTYYQLLTGRAML